MGNLAFIRTTSDRMRQRIFNTLICLTTMPSVSIVRNNSILSFRIEHLAVFVPDFSFEWSESMQHYLVYIHVASTKYNKTNAGYAICTIKNSLTAALFITIYQFFYKHRANVKG